MALALDTPQTLLGTLLPKAGTARLLTGLATVVLGTLVLVLSAKISVPVQPVPVTLQTMAVAALAAAFGWRIGVLTVALYLLEGFVGLPVFATGGGPAYLLGPTGGFLVGFIPMVLIIGRAADVGLSRNLPGLFAVMVLGDAVCFALGFAWLLALSGSASFLDHSNLLGSAFSKAVQPFILWDILKMAFAAVSVAGGWAILNRRR